MPYIGFGDDDPDYEYSSWKVNEDTLFNRYKDYKRYIKEDLSEIECHKKRILELEIRIRQYEEQENYYRGIYLDRFWVDPEERR